MRMVRNGGANGTFVRKEREHLNNEVKWQIYQLCQNDDPKDRSPLKVLIQ